MTNPNLDYRKELKGRSEVFLKKRCPKCGEKLVLLPPDRIWCTSVECRYAEMHLIGDGVFSIPEDEIENVISP